MANFQLDGKPRVSAFFTDIHPFFSQSAMKVINKQQHFFILEEKVIYGNKAVVQNHR